MSTQKIWMPREDEGPEVFNLNNDPIPVHHEGLFAGQRSSLIKTPASYTIAGPRRLSATLRTLLAGRGPLLVSLLVVLCAGIAIGVGIGYTVGKKSIDATPAQQTQFANSTTPAGVTSGTTGIAAYSCQDGPGNDLYTTNTSNPTLFTEQCFQDYPAGFPIYTTTTNQTNVDLLKIIVYTFQSCMDACVNYNQGKQNTTQQCHAVTYVANLTYIIPAEGGNCFFKPYRGVPINGVNPAANYSLYASAYMTDF